MLILQGNVAQLVKNPPATAGDRDAGSIPGWERSPGEENGAPIQYSCLGNATDREAWRVAVCGVAKSQTQPSAHTETHTNSNSSSLGMVFESGTNCSISLEGKEILEGLLEEGESDMSL